MPGAFGDGESSSPSNTGDDPLDFPRWGIRDLVRAQHRLLTGALGIERVHAVVGMSMGGMQALEWAFTFPGFASRTASIVGSPRFGSYDAMFWETELRLIEDCLRAGCGAAGPVIYTLEYLIGLTPERWLASTPRDSVPAFLQQVEGEARSYFDGGNTASQIRAMLRHDAAAPFGGSLSAAAAALRSDLLLVIGPRDHMVTPASTRELAEAAGVDVVELGGDCGHYVWSCEPAALNALVADFLAAEPRTAARSPAGRPAASSARTAPPEGSSR